MFNIVLYEPEIPPNTGNVIRLCANTGAQLHLIKPLGFKPDDAKLKRAGLDYHIWAQIKVHKDFLSFRSEFPHARIFACTTKGKTLYTTPQYSPGDVLLFGPETRGLPQELLAAFPEENKLRIPMLQTSRSLNLSNSVAVVLFEAWRQQDFNRGE